MDKKIKIVFLYTELAGYFISCLEELLRSYPVEVHLFRWPLNKEAPFDFRFPESLKVYNRREYTDTSLKKIVEEINPDLIYSSGWVDKGYTEICRSYSKNIPVIVGIDNQWEGKFRQRLACLLRGLFIKPFFNRAWVPGEKQKEFASRLGFSDDSIMTGLYAADVDYFHRYCDEFIAEKTAHFPKRFIYVGRYLPHKGIYEMWNAFIALQNENPNEWELWCLGTGDDWDKRPIHDKIKHFGFVQPADIKDFVRQTGVFILPSRFEPWGVVVHEFAASGFPLLCSDKVGAANVFVQEGQNGFRFAAGDEAGVKSAMKKIMSLKEDELLSMGKKSHELSMTISPEKWAVDLMNVIQQK